MATAVHVALRGPAAAAGAGDGGRGGVGVAPIPADLVAAAVTEPALEHLAPQPLSLSLALAAAAPPGPAESGVDGGGASSSAASAPLSAFPAHRSVLSAQHSPLWNLLHRRPFEATETTEIPLSEDLRRHTDVAALRV